MAQSAKKFAASCEMEDQQKAIESINKVQKDIDQLNETLNDEIQKVENKYKSLQKPLFQKRSDIISTIPNFWVSTFMNHPQVSALLSKEDQEVLRSRIKIDVSECDDKKCGIKIHFDLTKETPQVKAGTKMVQEESFFGWFNDQMDAGADALKKVMDDIWSHPLQYFLASKVDDEEESEADDDDEGEEDVDAKETLEGGKVENEAAGVDEVQMDEKDDGPEIVQEAEAGEVEEVQVNEVNQDVHRKISIGPAYEALHEDIPHVITTLQEKTANLRSLITERTCLVCQSVTGAGPFGPMRKLTRKIEQLEFSLDFHIGQQFQMKTNNPVIYWNQIQHGKLRYEALLEKEKKLNKYHQVTHHRYNDLQSLHQKLCLNNICAILSHPLLEDYGNQSTTVNLISAIHASTAKAGVSCSNLANWLRTINSDVARQYLVMTESVARFVEGQSPIFQEFLATRSVMVGSANTYPNQMGVLCALEVSDTNNAFVWFHSATTTIMRLKLIETSAINHVKELDQNTKRGGLFALSLASLLAKM